MNLPAYIGKGAFASGINAISVGLPTNIRNDDLLILFVESANEAITAPAGWTQVTNSPQFTGTAAAAGGVRLGVYYRIAAGVETAASITDTGNHQTAFIINVRGANPASPFHVTAGNFSAATTAMSFPSVTTTVTNTLIINAAAMDTDLASTATVTGWANANLTGITEIHDQTISSGVGGGLAVAYGNKASAGSVGYTTATGSTSVTHAYLTLAIQGKSPSIRTVGQYSADGTKVISIGSTAGSSIKLAAEVSPAYARDIQISLRAEAKTVGDAFTNASTVTERDYRAETSDIVTGARGGTLIHDTLNDRYIFFGGYDGTTRFNAVFEKSLKTPQAMWRKLSPSGTPPGGRNLHGTTYVRATNSSAVEKAYLISWGGWVTADTNEMFALDITTPGSEAWTTITQTSAPTARSYITRHLVSTAVSGQSSQNYIYFFGGYATANRENQLVRCTFDVNSPTAVTWTTLKANGTAGNPTGRSGAILDYKPSTNKLYLYGGYSGSVYLTDFWSYDIAGNTWTQETVGGTAPDGTELGFGGYDRVNNKFWYGAGWQGSAATIKNHIGYISGVGGTQTYTQVRPHDADNQAFAGGASIASCMDNTRNWLVQRGQQTIDSNEVYAYIIDLNETSDETYKTVYGMAEGENFMAGDAPANAYDPISNRLISVGGVSNMYDDTTIVNGSHTTGIRAYNPSDNTWRYAVQGYKSVPAHEGGAAAWDSKRNRMLTFGGLTGNGQRSSEVWSLISDAVGNYKATRLRPSGTVPISMWLCAAAYDSVNDRFIVTMGGAVTTIYNQVWALSFASSDDGTWSQLSPTGTAPTPVVGPGYATKSSANRLYIFGGATNTALTTVSAQLACLDMTTASCAWVTITSSGGTGRRTPSLGYDPTNDYLITFGGFNGTTEVQALQYFSLSGTTWTSVTPTGDSPTARRSPGYGFINGKFYLHQGRPATGMWYRDTWELAPNYGTPASSVWTNKYPKSYVPIYANFSGANGDYHWQSFFTQDDETVYSTYGNNAESVKDFTIGTVSYSSPTVTTSAATSVSYYTATGNGNVTSDNGKSITERGVCWNTTGSPTTGDSKATTTGTTGAYTVPMTGLSSGQTYYVKAYAINADGTGYGSEVSFTALNYSATVALNTANGVSFNTDTTPTLEFTGTDSESNDLAYNVQISTVELFEGVTSYHFNASDAAPTDPNSVWTSEASAFDNSVLASWATVTATGSVSSNYLMAEGTNSATSGGPISQVQVRIHGMVTGTSAALNAAIYTNGLGQLLGTATVSSPTADYGSYITLNTPTGGWTWQKLNDLEVKIYASTSGTFTSADAYGVAISVTTVPLLDKLSASDAGFVNTVNGGDTTPFTSGQKISYTVQAGDALTIGTYYYWRARAIDPSGSNTWGEWSETRLFAVGNFPPTVALNTTNGTAFGVDTTPTLEFTGTDSEADAIAYNIQISTSTLISGNVTYYFNASDAAISDPNAVWENGSQAFDSNILSTWASVWVTGSVSSNYLMAQGTNSATSGGIISQVRVRIYGSVDGTSALVNAAVYTNNLGELLGTATMNSSTPGYGSYATLSTPTGGWTWQKLNDLEVKTYGSTSGTFTNATIYGVEIDVTISPLLNKLSASNPGFANTEDGGDTNPFTSGQKISYTVQAGEELTNGTYYWQVRGIDPSGTNTYGAWSAVRSFTVGTASSSGIKVYTGASFVMKPVKIYTGGSWVAKPVKRHNGSGWV